MKWLLSLLVGLLVLLQYQLWFGQGSVGEVAELEKRLERQRAENARLEERNRVLASEVRDLKTGLDAIEERARSELGMVAEDETFFQVVEGGGRPATARDDARPGSR